MQIKENLLKFFQSSSRENSSKRLVFVLATLFSFYEVDKSIAELILNGAYGSAVDILNSFLIFVSIAGGLVTAELLVKIFEIYGNFKNNTLSSPSAVDYNDELPMESDKKPRKRNK